MNNCGWVRNGGKCILEQENKKYKEVIDKANKYIDKMFKTGFYNNDYYLGHLKMILEDKEVE